MNKNSLSIGVWTCVIVRIPVCNTGRFRHCPVSCCELVGHAPSPHRKKVRLTFDHVCDTQLPTKHNGWRIEVRITYPCFVDRPFSIETEKHRTRIDSVNERPCNICTVAILAQGTLRGVAVTQAYSIYDTANNFLIIIFSCFIRTHIAYRSKVSK